MIRFRHVDSPLGPLLIAADEGGLHVLDFPNERRPTTPDADWHHGDHPILQATARQLDEYFAGKRKRFDLPLAPRGTPFQQRVWQALRTIPWGTTWNYGQLARAIDKPTASRAVGAANGRNPIGIIIPCHRVIGAGGALTGFGGGLPAKEFLLRLEGALPPALFRA